MKKQTKLTKFSQSLKQLTNDQLNSLFSKKSNLDNAFETSYGINFTINVFGAFMTGLLGLLFRFAQTSIVGVIISAAITGATFVGYTFSRIALHINEKYTKACKQEIQYRQAQQEKQTSALITNEAKEQYATKNAVVAATTTKSTPVKSQKDAEENFEQMI